MYTTRQTHGERGCGTCFGVFLFVIYKKILFKKDRRNVSSNTLIADFPFTIPTYLDIDIFGGIITNRCTWSGWMLNSVIVQPILSDSSLKTFSTSLFISPVNILNLYFGTQIMWYWQYHIECAKLWKRLIVILRFFAWEQLILGYQWVKTCIANVYDHIHRMWFIML